MRKAILQCSMQRVNDNKVLLQCGSGFNVTDNKGVRDMLKALSYALEKAVAASSEGRESLSRTPRQGSLAEVSDWKSVV